MHALKADASLPGSVLGDLPELPEELGDAMTCLAEAELDAGRLETARAILEGVVVATPEAPRGWILLSRTHRRLGQPLAARFCAEVALRLVPEDGEARLARVESLLALPGDRAGVRTELAELVADGEVGARAQALLGALGE
jgi:hypothetical protein